MLIQQIKIVNTHVLLYIRRLTFWAIHVIMQSFLFSPPKFCFAKT